MSNATIFLIDLGPRAAAMQKALSSMGFQVGAGSHAQLAEVLGQALPDVVVAPEAILSEVKVTLEAVPGGAEVLLFLLADEGAAASSRVPAGATARVPADIDAGVLGLRIQAAAQTSSSVRNRQETLVGFSPADLLGTPGFPQKAPSVPPVVEAAPVVVEAAPVGMEAAPIAPVSSPVLKPAASGRPMPPPALSQPSVSQAPGLQSAQSRPSSAESPSRVLSSAAPLAPTPEPPALHFEDTAPPASVFPSPYENSAASASPVALTVPPEAMEPAANRKKLIFASAIAAVLVLGVGVFAFGGDSSDKVSVQGEAEPAEAASTEELAAAEQVEQRKTETAANKIKPENASENVAAKLKPAGHVDANDEPVGAEATAAALSDSDSALFRIEAPRQLDSCESQLGKSEADYQGTAKWKSSQAWKLARKSLMSGKQDQAAKQMCESAFIDAKGPAVAGLVNYYLSERALEQAHKWALKGVEVSPKSRAAQEALGDVLNQMGRVDEARDVWLSSFGLKDKNDPKIAGVVKNYVRAAVTARKGGAYPLAERLLRRALSFEPDNADANALFAVTLRKNGQDALAEKWESRTSQL